MSLAELNTGGSYVPSAALVMPSQLAPHEDQEQTDLKIFSAAASASPLIKGSPVSSFPQKASFSSLVLLR